MPTTPNYAFPYPALTDAPNGPTQIQALAEAIDDKLFDRTKLFTVGAAASSTDNTLSGTHEDIAGTSVSFTTANANALVIVHANWDFSFSNTAGNESNHIIGYFSVDAVEQTKQALLRTLPNNRATVGQNYLITLASAGSHTLKQRVSMSAGSGTGAANSPHTSWCALVLDLA